MAEVDTQQVEEALEKITNSVMIIRDTMAQSTPEHAGAILEDLLNDCQQTHQFLESSAESVIFQGQEALFDRIAETMEKYRNASESYSQWVLGDGGGQPQGDQVEAEAPVIDERLMTSSIPGDLFNAPLQSGPTLTSSIDLDWAADVSSKKKRKDGKKKKDKEPVAVPNVPGEDFWNSFAGVMDNAPFQEGNLMEAGPTTPPSVVDGATFPKVVEQPLPPMDTSHPSLRTSANLLAPEDVFPQSAMASTAFGHTGFLSPVRQSLGNPLHTPQSTVIRNDRDARGSLLHTSRKPESPHSFADATRQGQRPPADEMSPRSGWKSSLTQKSVGVSKEPMRDEEVPGTITVRLTLPRLNYADLPPSFNNLFATEISEALSISELRIRVVDVKPVS